jgi:integrase/recombinase XerD
MIEDMAIRKFAAKTQHDYVQRVEDFAAFLGRSPHTAKSEDVRRFRLHLTSSGTGTPKINATVSALRFFFKVTLDRPELAKHPAFIHEPRKVPVVLRTLRTIAATISPCAVAGLCSSIQDGTDRR